MDRRHAHAQWLVNLDTELCAIHGRHVDQYGICYPVTADNPTPGTPCLPQRPLEYDAWLYTIRVPLEMGARVGYDQRVEFNLRRLIERHV